MRPDRLLAVFCLLLVGMASAGNNHNGNKKSSAVATSSSSSISNANASSSSGVSDSGNSNNYVAPSNTNAASGNSVSQTYKDTRQTPFSYAPDAVPTAPCIKGYSAGASSPILAGTFGAGKVDKGCDSRKLPGHSRYWATTWPPRRCCALPMQQSGRI